MKRLVLSLPLGLGLPRAWIKPDHLGIHNYDNYLPPVVTRPTDDDPPTEPIIFRAGRRRPDQPEESIDMLPDADRPNPLQDAANKTAKVWGLIVAVLGAASTFGIITVAQEDAVLALGDQLKPTVLVVGTLAGALIPLLGNLIGAFRTAKAARPNVTPVDDPRILDPGTGELVALTPIYRLGRHSREPTL